MIWKWSQLGNLTACYMRGRAWQYLWIGWWSKNPNILFFDPSESAPSLSVGHPPRTAAPPFFYFPFLILFHYNSGRNWYRLPNNSQDEWEVYRIFGVQQEKVGREEHQKDRWADPRVEISKRNHQKLEAQPGKTYRCLSGEVTQMGITRKEECCAYLRTGEKTLVLYSKGPIHGQKQKAGLREISKLQVTWRRKLTAT